MAITTDQVTRTGSFLRLICYFLRVELDVERYRQESDRRKMYAMVKQIGDGIDRYFSENMKENFPELSTSRVGVLMRQAKQWHQSNSRYLKNRFPRLLAQRMFDLAELGHTIEVFFRQFPEQRPLHSKDALFSQEDQWAL